MREQEKNTMKVLTDATKSVGMVALELSHVKRSTYVGTFTVRVLKELVESLGAGFDQEHPVELHSLYSDTAHAYILLASDKPEEMMRLAAVGCDCGADGNG